jgi:type I restriction-modification system DNA methylase subunit
LVFAKLPHQQHKPKTTMHISWNEIKARALRFSKEWENESREHAEAKTFWDEFFHIFDISRRKLASFEEPVKKLNDQYGFIDLFWKGTLLVEHKSKGKSLDKAYSQALDYFNGLKNEELPKYVLVSDFERFRLYDLDEGTEHDFPLNELHKNVRLFRFMIGLPKIQDLKPEDPVNRKAAELMGKLHDELKEAGYSGHNLEVFLVRLLFCLFADDTGIFEKDTFKFLIKNRTQSDGSDVGSLLSVLFQVLDTPPEQRQKTLDEDLVQFPYVNGNLFAETLRIPSFNSSMRQMVTEAGELDWGKISPAIFGSMFQSVMKPEERRNLGAHYTSEKNILKLIKPLFLDDLWDEFEKVKRNTRQLKEFHHKLSTLNFLDPACGCGNFLVITYKELRLLELEILRELFKHGEQVTQIDAVVWMNVDQFYGMEYDEWPSRIAEVAMWLVDHQMNMLIMEEFGQYFARLPLKKTAKIVNGNALRINWEEVVPKDKLSYILGNPPFVGKNFQNKEQKSDLAEVFKGVKGAGNIDYVTAWYIRAAQYIQNSKIKVAFVSTNSITQGEQVGILWNELFAKYGIKIHFAHRTFKWNNEARGKAAVHVVIIGFANFDISEKSIFEYDNIKGEPHQVKVKNINPYLAQGSNNVLLPRNSPVCNVPKMVNGSKVVDGGNLIFTKREKDDFIKMQPTAEKYIRLFIGSDEYINNRPRWCLYLKDTAPDEIRQMPFVLERIKKVKEFRENSVDKNTQKWASNPTLFMANRQPESDYLLIPRVSSENRPYVPIGYLSKDVIISDRATALPNATPFMFGVITSLMHMVWMKYTCGRMKSDFNYSNSIVYNNFPWPENPTEKQKQRVEEAAQNVLDARSQFPDSSLADLYDPLTMPPVLVKAHQKLDKSVDLCYRPQPFVSETNRIEFLFELYDKYVNPLIANNEKRAKKLM